MVTGLKPPVSVIAGCENQVGIRHELEAAGHRVAEQYCAFHIPTVENIVSLLVQQTTMKVHAIACLILHRFRHEARHRSTSFRDGTYTPLHANDLIAVLKWIIRVSDVDFVLSGCRLLQYSLKGQALYHEGLFDLLKEFRVLIKSAQTIEVAARLLL